MIEFIVVTISLSFVCLALMIKQDQSKERQKARRLIMRAVELEEQYQRIQKFNGDC